ncbi:Pr6Pr family membrane protein [Nocardia vinacea]|uniref:Pr6Pr family membrane protein n=1 Tax=Nocardia vinacea TaxID=96468 RepID=UPI002E0EB250|nr:Pr6Pr family membrane protein [Nocardia vinacea]
MGRIDEIGAIRARRWQAIRGAATLYLLITGVVYAVLLAKVDVMLTDRWINDILHRILPIVMVLNWILVPVTLGISHALIGGWLIYPVVYGAHTLIRGPSSTGIRTRSSTPANRATSPSSSAWSSSPASSPYWPSPLSAHWSTGDASRSQPPDQLLKSSRFAW